MRFIIQMRVKQLVILLVNTIKMNSIYNKKYVIFILQLTIIMNAVNMGWSINQINDNKIILSKKISKITDMDDNLYKFMNNIIP
jgi:hypothetical protein